ncbi:MAG: 30S ribosome-binding factor RbfA [Cytophagales bacterium]|jgi:ribosome-binding factor A|nr:30S ribosome-binding factor RbfA [Cytophagales bacterium]
MNQFFQQKKEILILRALQNIFLLKIQKADPQLQNLTIAVTRVEVAKTTSYVKVFFNVFPEDNQKNFVNDLNKNKSAIRKLLGDSLGDKLRVIPDLKFLVDDSMMRMRRMEELLKKIN